MAIKATKLHRDTSTEDECQTHEAATFSLSNAHCTDMNANANPFEQLFVTHR